MISQRQPAPSFVVLASLSRAKPFTISNRVGKEITIPPDFPVYYVASRQLGMCGSVYLTRKEAQALVDTLLRVWRPSSTKAWYDWFTLQYRSGKWVAGLALDTFGKLEKGN